MIIIINLLIRVIFIIRIILNVIIVDIVGALVYTTSINREKTYDW